jgi:O-antigen ligase
VVAIFIPGIFWLLPHFIVPGGAPYLVPLASVAVLGAVLYRLVTLRVHVGASAPPKFRRILVCWYLWLAYSALYGQVTLQQSGADILRLTEGAVDYWQVALQRLLQVALAIAAYATIRTAKAESRQLMRWWLQGTWVAVGLHAVVYATSSEYLALRAGTFVEGNHGGLYYLLSLFVALEYRRCNPTRWSLATVALCLLGVLFTQSSTALLVLVVALAGRQLAGSKDIRQALKRLGVLISFTAVVVSLIVVAGADFGTAEKLLEEDVTAASFSRIDRLLSVETALDLFTSSPIFGHGLQSYGFLANDYLSGPLAQIYDWSFRRIPNNIYAELLAETGAVGTVLLLFFVAGLVRRTRARGRDPAANLFGGMVAVLVYWLAFPTYSLVFVWVYFALVHRGAALRAVLPRPGRSPTLSFG